MESKSIVPVYINLEHKETGAIILGYVEVETLAEAQKYVEEKYSDYKVTYVEVGTRQKL